MEGRSEEDYKRDISVLPLHRVVLEYGVLLKQLFFPYLPLSKIQVTERQEPALTKDRLKLWRRRPFFPATETLQGT